MKNSKINQKKKYNDIKKICGKGYFKSYFIRPKANLSLSPSTERMSDIKKNEIISNINSSNNASLKNKDSQIVSIPNQKTDSNYFKLTKEGNKNCKKAKILIKSLLNNNNNSLNQKYDISAYNNYISASQKKRNINNKKKKDNNSNFSNSDYIYSKILKNIKKNKTDMNIKNNNNKTNKNHKKVLCDSLFKMDRDSKIKQKNIKNKNKTILKNEKSKKELEYNVFNDKELKININKSNHFIKKIKINNIVNNYNINKNKSYEYLYKKKSQIEKKRKTINNIKKDESNYFIYNNNDYQSLYSKIFRKKNDLDFPRLTDRSIKQNKQINNINDINNNGFKNKSIDVNYNRAFKKNIFNILNEERKKLQKEEIRKKMEEIRINSDMRKQKYLQLFSIINDSFSDIKKLIEQIEKEDLLKDITSKINDDKSYDSILNNENSISIEQTFKSLFNNRIHLNKNINNNNSNENTTIINNDFSFEEDKKDIPVKPNTIENNNNILDNNNNININSNFEKNENTINCFIF